MKKTIAAALSNKVVLYMATRYATYGLAFIVSLFIAEEMGPRYYGIWGFLLMVFGYFNLINWGVPQSVQVLLIQNKESSTVSANYEKTGLYLMGIISLSCFFVIGYYLLGGFRIIHDNNLGLYLFAICLCGVFNYFNLYYSKIYRTRNRLLELSFQQSSVVVLMFLSMLFFGGASLLMALVISYVVATCLSMLFYLLGGAADYSGNYISDYAQTIVRKGFLLFLYNSGFYLIMVSTQTMISNNYSLEEFGFFTFSYTLGYAVFQLLDAFAYLITTKLLYRYRSSDMDVVMSTIRIVRDNFVSLFHGLTYLAIMIFPLLLLFMPQYSNTLQLVCLCCLTMLLYTNSFGYSTMLMARNKEKILAMIAVSSLILNVFTGLALIYVFNVTYNYVIVATMIAYIYFAFMCVLFGRRELGLPLRLVDFVHDCFPIGLLIPFICTILVFYLGFDRLIFLPFVLFVLLNVKTIIRIYNTFKMILFNPNVIDI